MGIYIRIEKTSEKDGIHYYKVSPSSSLCDPFFITIVADLERIYFYKDQNCSNLLGNLDFISKQGFIEIEGLPSVVVRKVAAKIYAALKNKEFPHFLSIES